MSHGNSETVRLNIALCFKGQTFLHLSLLLSALIGILGGEKTSFNNVRNMLDLKF